MPVVGRRVNSNLKKPKNMPFHICAYQQGMHGGDRECILCTSKVVGMERISIYKEIKDGRLPIKKADKKTLIAVVDIHKWFGALPER